MSTARVIYLRVDLDHDTGPFASNETLAEGLSDILDGQGVGIDESSYVVTNVEQYFPPSPRMKSKHAVDAAPTSRRRVLGPSHSVAAGQQVVT